MSLKIHSRQQQGSAPFYLEFLKTKQEEIIQDLQKEIEKLRSENSELKFQLFVSCPEISPSKPGTPKRDKKRNSKSNGVLHDSFNSTQDLPAYSRISDDGDTSRKDQLIIINNKNGEIKRLELELISARKIIEELKWVQVHYENKMQVQELKLDELQREIIELKSTELEIFQLQIPPVQCESSRNSYASTPKTSAHRRHRSSSTSRCKLDERRPSLQSILPDNYKDSVATLPPISKATGEDEPPNTTAYRALIKNTSHNHGPCTATIKLMSNPRYHRLRVGSSNQIHGSPTNALLPMKTPALVESSTNKKNF